MSSKIALARSSRVRHFFRFKSSICRLDQKETYQSGCRNNRQSFRRRASVRKARILFVNANEVNWTPWSACTIPPAGGWRFLIAMSSALTRRVESLHVVDRPAHDLPRRTYPSRRNRKPSLPSWGVLWCRLPRVRSGRVGGTCDAPGHRRSQHRAVVSPSPARRRPAIRA